MTHTVVWRHTNICNNLNIFGAENSLLSVTNVERIPLCVYYNSQKGLQVVKADRLKIKIIVHRVTFGNLNVCVIQKVNRRNFLQAHVVTCAQKTI